MSMNLYCVLNGEKVDLWQTPTHVTRMCLYGKKDPDRNTVTGKAAQKALALYKIWGENTILKFCFPEELIKIKKTDQLTVYTI